MRIVLFFFTLPLWASDGEAAAILQRWIDAQDRNDRRAEQYTYHQETERFAYDSQGRLQKLESETHEVTFIEGLQYRKLVARNGKPLPRREQTQVEKAMRQTAEERRRHLHPPPPGGMILAGDDWADVGSPFELLTLFDNRLVGEETVRGRRAWLIESTPKPGVIFASEHEQDVRCFRKRIWIDEEDNVAARMVYTVIDDHIFAKPGSTLTFEYEKIGADTWHEVLVILDLYRAGEKTFQPSGHTEYRLSGFQKFDVQSTISMN